MFFLNKETDLLNSMWDWNVNVEKLFFSFQTNSLKFNLKLILLLLHFRFFPFVRISSSKKNQVKNVNLFQSFFILATYATYKNVFLVWFLIACVMSFSSSLKHCALAVTFTSTYLVTAENKNNFMKKSWHLFANCLWSWKHTKFSLTRRLVEC